MECGNCHICCKLPEIKETESPLGKWCKHCKIGTGCMIYNDRPEECSKFNCMYQQMEKAREDLRPDKSHVMFEKFSDGIICGVIDPDYKMSKAVKKQILSFHQENYSLVMFSNRSQKPTIYAAKGRSDRSIYSELTEIQKRRNKVK